MFAVANLQQELSLILACSAAAMLAAVGLWWRARRRQAGVQALPTDWAITARPVFNTDERRVYRQLREALPQHIVLSKLPLVRFCQPTDPTAVRFWYGLLGSVNVTFAVCSANGRVLAAIDLDSDRGNSKRVMQIKHSVLRACRVRYMRCPVDHLPSIPELQLLVPQAVSSSRAPQSDPAPEAQRNDGEVLPAPLAQRGRADLWQDSGFLQDSFFGAEPRTDSGSTSDFGALRTAGGSERLSPELPPGSASAFPSGPPPSHP